MSQTKMARARARVEAAQAAVKAADAVLREAQRAEDAVEEAMCPLRWSLAVAQGDVDSARRVKEECDQAYANALVAMHKAEAEGP